MGARPTPPNAGAAKPPAVNGFQPIVASPPGGAAQMVVEVEEGSPAAVIDLGAVFGEMHTIRHGEGLQLAMLGNTNSALVKTDLSETVLTLNFAPGKYGNATLTVSATDADGVSVKETLVVTVLPRATTYPRGVSPISARGPDGATAGSPP